MLPEAGYLCIPAVLPILKEVVSCYVPGENNQAQENQEDPTSIILGVVANIFQKIIELLARYLRKEPEETKKVFIEPSNCLLGCFQYLHVIYYFLQCSNDWLLDKADRYMDSCALVKWELCPFLLSVAVVRCMATLVLITLSVPWLSCVSQLFPA